MLQSLELENFKAFGERARIPFAPITLIFGENSAGKSSILQALNLLKQTRESRDTGALLLPRDENGIVDLGSFQEMIFDHDPKRVLSIRVETKVDDVDDVFELPFEENKIAIEFSFKRTVPRGEVHLNQIEIYYGKSSKCLARFRPSDTITKETEEYWKMIDFFTNPRSLSSSNLAAVKCVWSTKAVEYWKPEFEKSKNNKEEIIKRLKERLNDLQHSNEEYQKDDSHQAEIDLLKDDVDFFSSDFDLKAYISKRHNDEMNAVLGVRGFLPMIMGPHSYFRHRVYRTLDVVHLAVEAGRALEQTLEALFPMGPFRRPPQRWYIFTGTSPQDVGYRGDLLPDLLLRHPELVEKTNEWLERLHIGYELEVKLVGKDSGDLFEVRLVDTRRKERINVALPDVGFGISQLLPFVVQSLVSEKQIISIEQPEVHVHPKLQADLGDLLVEAIKEPRQNQFIVETHSEHLILRLQRLVRKKLLKPEEVSVIYISRGLEGAESRRLRLDEEGNFIDDWPGGFFLERLRELR